MSRIIDSKVSGQYIYLHSLSRYEKRKKKCGHSKEDKTKRRRTWWCFAPPPPFEQPVVVVVIPGMFGRDSIVFGNARLFAFGTSFSPSRNRRFYKGVLGNFLCGARVFLAQKKNSKIRVSEHNKP
jgi:hypothetical protein